MNIKPLGDRVLLKVEAGEEKTTSGLFIPQTAQEKTQTGTVTAIGTDEKISVQVQDKVMYDKYAGTTIEINREEYLIVKMDDIIAIVQ